MSKRPRRPTAPPKPALQPPASSPDAGRSEGRPPLDAPDAGRRDAGPFDLLRPAPPSAPAPGGAGPADGANANGGDDAADHAAADNDAIVGAKHSAARAGRDGTPGAECFAPTPSAPHAAHDAAVDNDAAVAASPARTEPVDAADDARRRSFYQKFFNTDETALIAAFHRNPTPEDELWLQRIVIRRLLARVPAEGRKTTDDDTAESSRPPATGGRRPADDGRTPQTDAGPGTKHARATAKDAAATEAGNDSGARRPAAEMPAEPNQAGGKQPAAEQGQGGAQTPAAPNPQDELKGLVIVAQQINAGAGRVAALLRDVRALGGDGWEKPPQAAQTAARELGPARDWEKKP